jgi:hypothetical protein
VTEKRHYVPTLLPPGITNLMPCLVVRSIAACRSDAILRRAITGADGRFGAGQGKDVG